MASLRILVVLSLGLCFAGTAAAKPKGAAEAAKAKQLYDEAMRHYNVGEFNDAAAKFIEAYKTKRDANFLYNAAQAYRLAGNAERALFFYKSYLRDAPEDAENRPEVEDRIKKLQEPPPPKPEPRPEPPPRIDTRVPAAAVPAEPRQDSGSGRPVYKKWWFWSALGAVAVTGVVVVVVLSNKSSGPGSGELGDVGPGKSSALSVRF